MGLLACVICGARAVQSFPFPTGRWVVSELTGETMPEFGSLDVCDEHSAQEITEWFTQHGPRLNAVYVGG